MLSGGRHVRAETTAGQPGGHGHSPMRTGEPSRAEPRRRAHGGPQTPEPRDDPGGSRQCHKGPGTADWRAPETQKPGSCLRRASPQTVGMVGVDALDRKRRPGDTGRGWPSGLAAGPSPARCTAQSRGLLGTQPVGHHGLGDTGQHSVSIQLGHHSGQSPRQYLIRASMGSAWFSQDEKDLAHGDRRLTEEQERGYL